jgi:uroporphyrinogen-III decarboxylase
MAQNAQELYQEREQRIMKAIRLERPDRIPIMVAFTYFPAKYAGVTFKDAWYDHDKWLDATMKTIVDYAPDGVWSIQGFNPGAALEHLEPKIEKWPGWGLADNNGHQAIEIESMKANEYDAYFKDKSDFIFRTMFGRMIGAAEPFKKLPPLSSVNSALGALAFGEALADPEVAEAIEKFQKAGRIYKEMRPKMMNFYKVAESLGFPCPMAPGGGAPFDAISDRIRGMQGAMIDMFRNPDKLHRLVDETLQRTLATLDAVPPFTKPARALMPLHRGSDGFMNLKQFEEFYWPGLKAIMLKMIEKGITPCPFLEGTWDQRLKYLLELPKGKVLAHFAYSDMKKAKEVLGGQVCIMGGVPSSLLNTGTAQEVEQFVKDLLKDCAKDGGLIVANNTINEGKPECVRAMIETVKKYGAEYL